MDSWKQAATDTGWPQAEAVASEADYMISECSMDKETNAKLLRKLSTKPTNGPHCSDGPLKPIKFCTDQSLGFGVHFVDGDELHTRDWRKSYKNAANKTRLGILVLNPSEAYFESKAWEFQCLDYSRTSLVVDDRILCWVDYLRHVEDKFVGV